MLSRTVTSAIASVVMLSGIVIGGCQVSQAQTKPYTVRFFCGQDDSGNPATLVQRSDRSKAAAPLIRWTSNYFTGAGYRPWTRCQMVSSKFQAAYHRNPNFLFTYSYVNREPVICAADAKGGRCVSVLYTVKRGVQDPVVTMLRLDRVRVGASGPLNESTASRTIAGSDYVSVQDVLAQHLEAPGVAPINTAVTPVNSPAAESKDTSATTGKDMW